VSKLLINEPPLQVLPSLAKVIGLNEAIVLQQIHYWISHPKVKEREGRKWHYDTYDGWKEQFKFWSISTIQRTVKNLEELGLVISKEMNVSKGDRTKWYTLNYDKLTEIEKTIDDSPSSQLDQMVRSSCTDGLVNLTSCTNTENESKNDTKNNNKGAPVDNFDPIPLNQASVVVSFVKGEKRQKLLASVITQTLITDYLSAKGELGVAKLEHLCDKAFLVAGSPIAWLTKALQQKWEVPGITITPKSLNGAAQEPVNKICEQVDTWVAKRAASDENLAKEALKEMKRKTGRVIPILNAQKGVKGGLPVGR